MMRGEVRSLSCSFTLHVDTLINNWIEGFGGFWGIFEGFFGSFWGFW